MTDYIFFMHDDAPAEESDWGPYFAKLKSNGCFEGGSAIGDGVCVRKRGEVSPLTSVAGYVRVDLPGECQFHGHNRLLGIRFDRFDWDGKKAVKEFSIGVVISNVGGNGNAMGSVIGGCFVNYTAKRKGKRWVVQLDSILDP